MTLQKKTNTLQAFGVEGSFYAGGAGAEPLVDAYTVDGGKVGLAYTVDTADPAKAKKAGTGVFAGIAVLTKEMPLYNGLEASLEIPANAIAQLCKRGRIVLKLADPVTVGQAAFYNTTTGEIKPGTAGGSVDSCVEIKGSQFVLYNALANELSVLELNP